MRDFNAVSDEIKEGSELIVVSRNCGDKKYRNAYISKDGINYEEIRMLYYFMNKVYIFQEIDNDNIFRVCLNKETGNYESAILHKTELDDNISVYDILDGKYAEDSYLFKSIDKLDSELKLAKKKQLLKEKKYNNYGQYKLDFNNIKRVS